MIFLRSYQILKLLFFVCFVGFPAFGQDLIREVGVSTGGHVEIVNLTGKVSVRAEPALNGKPTASTITASSAKGVTDSELQISTASGKVMIRTNPSENGRRIDVAVVVPERVNLTVRTGTGAFEFGGYFSSVTASSVTGTIAANVPTENIGYSLLWTESRPRVLSAVDLSPVREGRAGRFEIRGRHIGEIVRTPRPIIDDQSADFANPVSDDETPRAVTLNLTTARGIILLNVPPNEVNSDLRERPLTEAAKAIVRSGDSLLTEAIRRAAPKYFGDYMRTLPPLIMEPRLATRERAESAAISGPRLANVRVTDLKNRSIPGLTKSDFEITDGGEPLEIISVAQSTAPFNLVLLLDVSGSVENYVNFIRKAARSFVETVDKNDRVSIVIFNEDVKLLSRFTTDRGALSASLDTFDAGGGTAYYDALAYTLADTLRPLKGERSAIVILTDGDDNRSFLPFDSLAGSIQESGALIYPLYVPSGLIAAAAAGETIDPLRQKFMSLTAKSEGEGEELAALSGGIYYRITEIGQIQRAYEDIVLQLRAAYDVTYRSRPGSDGTSPRVKVRVKRENVFPAIIKDGPAN